MARLWTHLVRASALTAPTAKANENEQGMEVDAGSGLNSHVVHPLAFNAYRC